jgi:hypothetical protein
VLFRSAGFPVLTVQPREQCEALQARRAEQETDARKARYATRAGAEGTIARAVHRVGARRARYRGLPRARLRTILAAAVLNLIRLDAWLAGTPLATTRTSHFSQLALALTARQPDPKVTFSHRVLQAGQARFKPTRSTRDRRAATPGRAGQRPAPVSEPGTIQNQATARVLSV